MVIIYQINVLHDLYSVNVIYIFDVEILFSIYLSVYTSRHYGKQKKMYNLLILK